MQKNIIETITGAVILLIAGVFLAFAYKGSGIRMEDGYNVHANFSNASGIVLGSDVRIGGIKVGTVSNLTLDTNSYEAVISMQIRSATQIPKDSSASVVSSGLLGEKYIQITPGGEEKMLADGDKISFTQSAVNLEEMIGKFMFSGGGVDKNKSSPAPSSASSAPAPAAAP
jgi:phospholipid/cholesterol/gamma-HCH transport system substrate-binding protein